VPKYDEASVRSFVPPEFANRVLEKGTPTEAIVRNYEWGQRIYRLLLEGLPVDSLLQDSFYEIMADTVRTPTDSDRTEAPH
jgi:hypothetical protein